MNRLKDVQDDLILFPTFIKMLFGLTGELNEALKQVAKKYRLTRQDARVLWNLNPDKPISHVELAFRVTLPKSSITEAVKKLHHRGLVEKSGNPHDDRVSLITLTEEGHQVRHRMLVDWLSTQFFEAYQTLSLGEKKEFIRLSAKVTDRLLGPEFTGWALSSSGVQRYIDNE